MLVPWRVSHLLMPVVLKRSMNSYFKFSKNSPKTHTRPLKDDTYLPCRSNNPIGVTKIRVPLGVPERFVRDSYPIGVGTGEMILSIHLQSKI